MCIRRKQIKFLRLQKGLTQEEFAKKIGVSKTKVSTIETGSITKRRDKVCAIEIWVELFQQDINFFGKRQAREINDVLKTIDGWEPCKDKLRFGKLYNTQRGFVRKITGA